MSDVRITHVGGPTAILELGGWRLLTDPTFDPAGGTYRFGWGTGSEKLAGPAIAAADVGPIDAVLLSHDHHEDNLDAAGRALLPSAGVIVTTVPGAKRLTAQDGLRGVRGLAPWDTTVLEAEGKPPLTVTATPCRHGPPLSHPIVGEVVGFALSLDGAGARGAGQVWISGDTVLYDGVREVAARIDVDVAIVHLGGVRFPISGPLRYTLTAAEMVELLGLLTPRVAVPIHYEGWKHFRENRAAVEAELATAPEAIRDTIRWLPIGEPVDMSGSAPTPA